MTAHEFAGSVPGSVWIVKHPAECGWGCSSTSRLSCSCGYTTLNARRLVRHITASNDPLGALEAAAYLERKDTL